MASSKGSILVTGANGGLGTAIVARILKTNELASNYEGIYTVRKAATASQLQGALKKAPASHKHETVELDLSSISNVKKVCAEINGRVSRGEVPRIRALILNAAFQDAGTQTFTEDSLDMTWQVNFLANMLLALELLGSMDTEAGRIVILGSWSHDSADERNSNPPFSTPYEDPAWRDLFPGAEALAKGTWSTPEGDTEMYSGYRRYGASKLCAVMLMHELANRLAHDPKLSQMAVVGVDPGAMSSGLLRRDTRWQMRLTTRVALPMAAALAGWTGDGNGKMRTTSRSAADVVRAALEMAKPPGGELLYLDGSRERTTAEAARDAAKRRELWEYGLEVAGVGEGDTVLADWR